MPLAPDFFDDLMSDDRRVRADAWFALASWDPAQRTEARCPSGRYQGGSALAVAARGSITSWAPERLYAILDGTTATQLDTCSMDGVADGAWVWLGGQRLLAAASDTEAARIRPILTKLHQIWGKEKIWSAVQDMAIVVPHLDAATQQFFAESWQGLWKETWKDIERSSLLAVVGTPLEDRLQHWVRSENKGLAVPGAPHATLLAIIKEAPEWALDHQVLLRQGLVRGHRLDHWSDTTQTPHEIRQGRSLVRQWLAVQRCPHVLVSDLLLEKLGSHPSLGPELYRLQVERVERRLRASIPEGHEAPAPRRMRI